MDFGALDRFTLSFDSQPEPPRCPHCSKSDQLVSLGAIYKQRSSHEREAVGKRVLCNRYQHSGCGQTFPLYVASVLPRRRYSAAHLFAFLSALLLGMAVESAYWRATGQNDARHGWRCLHRLEHKLIDFRQQGGFSVIVGEPGVGNSVLREYIEQLGQERDITVASCSRTLNTYLAILKQLAESFKIEAPAKDLEKALIGRAFGLIRERNTLYILIDEAHLLDMTALRKLRLLFEQFPKQHNLILFGQRDLLHYLALIVNRDIKSRITYSATIKPLNDEDMERYIVRELETARMGLNSFNEAAIELIIRSAQGNLRLCPNLCYGSLIEAAREIRKIVAIADVNSVLIQPHWRSHDELIKQQAA